MRKTALAIIEHSFNNNELCEVEWCVPAQKKKYLPLPFQLSIGAWIIPPTLPYLSANRTTTIRSFIVAFMIKSGKSMNPVFSRTVSASLSTPSTRAS